MQLHARGDVTLRTETHPLEAVNDVLDALREGEVTGRAVLVPDMTVERKVVDDESVLAADIWADAMATALDDMGAAVGGDTVCTEDAQLAEFGDEYWFKVWDD